MRYLQFSNDPDFRVGFLVSVLNQNSIRDNYIDQGFNRELAHRELDQGMEEHSIAYQLPMNSSGSGRKVKLKAPPVVEQREFLKEVLDIFVDIGVEYVFVAQPNYYKTLTGESQAQSNAGTLKKPCKKHFPDYDQIKVVYVPNHQMGFYDPEKTSHLINLGVSAVIDDLLGTYSDPGKNIIHSEYYPQTEDEIRRALHRLLRMHESLTCDIEGFSLNHQEAGIASISFAWNEHEGIAFRVDYAPGFPNYSIRNILKHFINDFAFFSERAQGDKKLIFHNAAYDVMVLVYQLFSIPLSNLGHNPPQRKLSQSGICNNWRAALNLLFNDEFPEKSIVQCTKIISYLATNSCAGNELGLKKQALEFAGDYSEENIKDVTKIPNTDLLRYNLKDCLATWYVWNKNTDLMRRANQQNVYDYVFLPALRDVIEMQLNGIPVDMDEVADSRRQLEKMQRTAQSIMRSFFLLDGFEEWLNERELAKKNAAWKVKSMTLTEWLHPDNAKNILSFNPNSDQQLQTLLYGDDFMGLPIVDKTDSGAPATGAKTLKKLILQTKEQRYIDFIEALIEYKDIDKLLTTFIPAMENAFQDADGNWFMHGNFNLGGTVSGRLSSSDPNLQNLPSKSKLAYYIKKCIKAPPGYVWCGIDFDSLEDKISALTTKDPMKLKVYVDGYDGHCLRAHSYFGNQMTGIDPNCVESINSIDILYPKLRQRSKAPTFLLTYGGTALGLVMNCGFTVQEAEEIERKYHELYRVSDEWVASKIEQASKDGYVTLAFGLRLRTPVLEQVILGNNKTPNAARQEARTAGNALGQSWGLLNTTSATRFNKRVRKDGPTCAMEVRQCAQIHDAQYYLVKEDPTILAWCNRFLVKEVSWQDDPLICHPDVKISGQMMIYYPSWNEEHSVPLEATTGLSIEKVCAEIGNKVGQ